MSNPSITIAVWGNVPFQRNMLKSYLKELPYEIIDLNKEYGRNGGTLNDRKLADICRKRKPDILFFGYAGFGYDEDIPGTTHWKERAEGINTILPPLLSLTEVVCYAGKDQVDACKLYAEGLGAKYFLDLVDRNVKEQAPQLVEQILSDR